MRNKTDDELKQLARDIHGGRVFTSMHIRTNPDHPPEVRAQQVASMLGSIFLPLLLMSDELQRDNLWASEPMLFYEYLDKAGPRSINGYPQFLSVSVVTGEEWPALQRYLAALLGAADPLAEL